MTLVSDLLEDVQCLSPKSGDLLVFEWADESDSEALFPVMVGVKQKLLDLGIKTVLVSMKTGLGFQHVPKEALTEQGYLWRSSTREWLESHMPLGKRAPLLEMFDREFGTDAANTEG